MPETPGRKRRRGRWIRKRAFGIGFTILIVAMAALFLIALDMSRPHVGGDSLRLDVFVRAVERGQVETATLLDVDGYVVGRYRRADGSTGGYNSPYLKAALPDLVGMLLESDVPLRIDQQNGKRIALLASTLLPFMILVLLFIYLIVSFRRGTGLFGVRSGARKAAPAERRGVMFADVAGQDHAVAELREVVQFLRDPERFAALGASIPKGVLLYGPSGCGKTLLARALAGESGANFYSISGSDFVELYVGVGAARVRDLFGEARENSPAVIFIDELDSIGRARGKAGTAGSSGEQEQALNQILAEMDGFSPRDNVIVVAATNRPDVLDQALLRPGRFDRAVALERPDEGARLEILKQHARGKRLSRAVDLEALARRAVGLTGADLALLMNESAILAGRVDEPEIRQEHLEQALQRILSEPERQRRLSLRERGIGRRFSSDSRVTFADVAGVGTAIEELRDVRDYLAEPERFARLGARVPRGILLVGPPGCGKTLLARAVAGEVNAAFFSVSASEFVEALVGQGAARVRELFADAKAAAPAIIFVDEIDAAGGHRGDLRHGSTHREADQTLNQFLTEMDGFDTGSGVVVIAATNRPDMLDTALTRPGRFDRTVAIERPDANGRLEILRLHAKGKPLAPDADLRPIADKAIGLTGADLEAVMNEAALLASRSKKSFIEQQDLARGLQKMLEGPERQRRMAHVGRSVGRRFVSEERATFADVAGLDDSIEELGDIRTFLAAPGRFSRFGARPPKGVLLVGPPGCGKTLLARALAGEANAAFFSVSGSEFVQVFVGEGAARVRDLFAEARAAAPAIVFIDEIDAVGGRRSGAGSGSEREYEQTLNQFLTEMDGFDAGAGVVVMAATNRPDVLDPALVRAGRFDRRITIDPPDRKGRAAILALHARDKTLGEDVDLDRVAAITAGLTGVDLANVMNEAALLALRAGKSAIGMEVIEQAIERALLGISSRRRLLTEADRRLVAYHEAGHALIALTLPGSSPPHKITIVPRGLALGYVWHPNRSERVLHKRSELIDKMAVGLGGRVAEDIVFGELGDGAAGDLEVVTRLAEQMVCELGMGSQLGPIFLSEGSAGQGRRSPSPQTHQLIDADVRSLIGEAEARARTVLLERRSDLDRVATVLIEQETVTAAELARIVAPVTSLPVAGRDERPAPEGATEASPGG